LVRCTVFAHTAHIVMLDQWLSTGMRHLEAVANTNLLYLEEY